MKLLFVQLSDMHCNDSADKYTCKIDKAVDAIRSLGNVDAAVFIFSGDLTDTAAENEFKAGRKVIGRFISLLKEALGCGFIPTMIVPGNHDIVLQPGCRTAGEMEKWNKLERFPEEVARMQSVLSYVHSQGCFKKNGFFDKQIIDLNGVKVQFCLLNSAPYSTREPEDKQLHFLPPYTADNLIRGRDVDLKITVMHHNYEWCEWDTKVMLKKAITSDDVTFFGHDHDPEIISSIFSSGYQHNIIMGGRFNLEMDKETEFNAVIYDSNVKSLESYEFIWDTQNNMFKRVARVVIEKKPNELTPSATYLQGLMKDGQSISNSFEDYFVMPKLTVEGENFSAEDYSGYIDLDKVFDILKTDKVIRITGGSDSGKTTFLRYLYQYAAKAGFIPLMIENRNYRDSRIDRMFRLLLEDQYDQIHGDIYELYSQADDGKKIILLDDADLITNPRAREKLFADILGSGKMLIYTTTEKNSDLEEIVKDKLQGKSICTLDILPVYKETRDGLVEKIGALYKKSKEDVNAVKAALDYLVQSQTSFFSFTPRDTLQYIKFLFSEGIKEKKGTQTISLVFETNIRNDLLKATGPEMAGLYLMALEYIANSMYFELRKDCLEPSELESIIAKYNKKRKATINPKILTQACVEAHIFKESSGSFAIRFYDNNMFAYFVAKALNRELENNPVDISKLGFVMNHICFGINDTIVLFLSYIRSNKRIVLQIAHRATELMAEFPEWDFERQNIPFLHNSKPLSSKVPSAQEKKDTTMEIEQIEHGKHEAIQFRGIFDYNEADVNKKRFVVLKALKYTRLLGRALVDQYGSLEDDELAVLLEALFSVPQKVIYEVLKPNQEHIDEIVNSILQFAKEALPDEKITEEHIRDLLGQAGTILALNILNDIAYNASNACTIAVLRDDSISKNANYNIFELMMEENVGNTPEFVSRAISLRKQLERIPYACMLISQIARKHIIYSGEIDHTLIDALISGKVFSADSKPRLLLEKGKRSKD